MVNKWGWKNYRYNLRENLGFPKATVVLFIFLLVVAVDVIKLILVNFTKSCFFPIQVYEDEPVLQAFKVMRKKRIGGVPVIKRGGNKAVANISLRDVQFLLTAPEIFHDYRFVTSHFDLK